MAINHTRDGREFLEIRDESTFCKEILYSRIRKPLKSKREREIEWF